MTAQQERELDWMTGQRDAMKKLYDMEVEQHACTISVLEQTRAELARCKANETQNKHKPPL